jgi:hypothetical protein
MSPNRRSQEPSNDTNDMNQINYDVYDGELAFLNETEFQGGDEPASSQESNMSQNSMASSVTSLDNNMDMLNVHHDLYDGTFQPSGLTKDEFKNRPHEIAHQQKEYSKIRFLDVPKKSKQKSTRAQKSKCTEKGQREHVCDHKLTSGKRKGQICGEDFVFKHELNRHKKIHDPEFFYFCNYSKCLHVGKRVDNIKTHYATHEKKEKFYCIYCPANNKKSYEREDTLKRHIKTCHTQQQLEHYIENAPKKNPKKGGATKKPSKKNQKKQSLNSVTNSDPHMIQSGSTTPSSGYGNSGRNTPGSQSNMSGTSQDYQVPDNVYINQHQQMPVHQNSQNHRPEYFSGPFTPGTFNQNSIYRPETSSNPNYIPTYNQPMVHQDLSG